MVLYLGAFGSGKGEERKIDRERRGKYGSVFWLIFSFSFLCPYSLPTAPLIFGKSG
jgi:hypothetical protein